MGNSPVYPCRSCGHCADDCRCREDSVRLDLEANGEYLA